MVANKGFITGPGSFSGPGNIAGNPISGGFTYSYEILDTDNIFGFDGYAYFYFYTNPEELFTLAHGTVVTVSGVTGPYSALNGTTFEIDFAEPYPGYAYYDSATGGTFRSTWIALGLPQFGVPLNYSGWNTPSMIWSWN